MPTKKDKLVEYMVELNSNADLMAKHNADPAAAAKAYGLDSHDINLIVNNDFEAIKERFDDYDSALGIVIITFHSQG